MSKASTVAPLNPCSKFPGLAPKRCPVLICVMDGIGVGRSDQFNALHVANAPTIKSLMNPASPLFRTVRAHGTSVGLPSEDDMGNSEVGHNALGAGRIIMQGASLVDEAIKSNEVWQSAGWNHLKSAWKAKPDATFHFIGLLSDGGVHSRTDQLYALINRAARQEGCTRIRLHPLFDGRDVPDGSSVKFCKEAEDILAKISKETGCDAQIASGGGRMFITMDRYNADWKMVERGWQTHVLGNARKFASASEAIATFKKENPKLSDQTMPPFVVHAPGNPEQPVGSSTSAAIVRLKSHAPSRSPTKNSNTSIAFVFPRSSMLV
jgi:2,3-bisphosphoglycerate-independent phosphoglycerate mutase